MVFSDLWINKDYVGANMNYWSYTMYVSNELGREKMEENYSISFQSMNVAC